MIARLAMLVLTCAASAQVTLRGSAAPEPGTVEDVSLDGVALVSADGRTHSVLGWATVERVDGPLAEKAAEFRPAAEKAWRARERLVRGDAVAAEPIFEELFTVYEGRRGPTAAGVAEGLLRCRLRRGVHVGAVGPWLALLRAGGSGEPGVPGAQPVIDERSSLAPALPPMWLSGAAVEAFARAPAPPGATNDQAALLLAWYQYAAAMEMGLPVQARPQAPAGDATVQFVSRIVLARAGTPEERLASRRFLGEEMKRAGDTWREAWCRAAIGRSLIREDDAGARELGVIELLHLPARFGREQPYLAGLCMAEASVTLAGLGRADEARRLGQDLASKYPGHPALAWERLRTMVAGPAAAPAAPGAPREAESLPPG
ncbi:MAG: hypothetical protein IT439_00920 [Phycisphaerales bacterium]|nr:hypothetical protein [Phycisphaerales bacterium]